MVVQKLLAISLVSTEWIIWLLLLLSILSLAIIIEKAWVLRRKRGNDARLIHKINEVLKKKDSKAVEEILRNDHSASAEVSLKVIQHIKESGVDLEDSLAIALSEERVSLESRIAILGTLGSNAPFVGLFGTVLGIIHAFHSLAMNTKGGRQP